MISALADPSAVVSPAVSATASHVAGSTISVSSRFFGLAHAITYDLQGSFLPYMEKHCVQVSDNGSISYDFANAEQYLLEVVLSGKPLLDLEVRTMQFTNAASSGDSGNVSLLAQKVKQQPLPRDISENILKELRSPVEALRCLELLEVCISFLLTTGGSFAQHLDEQVANKLLSKYIKQDLLMDDNSKESEFDSKTISQQVQLKHIDSLWKLLRDCTVTDVFANVRPKYRQLLGEKQKSVLTMLCQQKKLDLDVLLPLMKEFVTSQLREDQTAASRSIKETIGFCEAGDQNLSDLVWFKTFFPDDLLMSHAMDAYQTLESVHS